MDPESKKLLEDTYALAQENNALLHKVRNVQKRDSIFSFLKWIVIIGITFGSFYFLQPYLEKLMNVWSSISGYQQSSNNILQDFLKNVQNTPR